MFGADGQRNIPHREWLVVFDQVLKDVKAELKEQGREDEFVDCRVRFLSLCLSGVLTAARSSTPPFGSFQMMS